MSGFACRRVFDRYSGFVRRFCREGPILRNPETGRTSFPRSRTRGRSALSPTAFPVLSPGARYISGTDNTMPGEFVLLLLSRFSARCRNCSPPGAFIGNRALRIGRSLRSDAESARNTGSCPAGRAAGLHPSRRLVDRRRRHPIPLGRIRQSYISLCGEHTRPGVAISPSRGLRLTDRVSDRFRPRGLCRRKKARARKPVRQGI